VFIVTNATNVQDLQRGESAKSLGVASGLTLPIVVDQKVLAVLFFVSTNAKQPKADELENFSVFARGLISSGLSKVCQ